MDFIFDTQPEVVLELKQLHPKGYWTKERCLQSAKTFKTKAQWRIACPGSYSAAKRFGIFESCISNMCDGYAVMSLRQKGTQLSDKNPNFKHTDEELGRAAAKYLSRGEFQDKASGQYQAARQRNLLDLICAHMPKNIRHGKPSYNSKWTWEVILEEALKYNTRTEFAKNSQSAYQAAHRLRILDQACGHMKACENERWSEEELKIEALKYKTRKALSDNKPGAYNASRNLGILNEICSHMPVNSVQSSAEKELLQFLQSVQTDFKSKHFGKYQIDCYSESLKIGVEYNGLFWHSEVGLLRGRPESMPKELKDYHLDKTKYFERQGIRLIHIWEHEWRDRPEQVKDFLRSACGKNQIKIGARKCQFREIPTSEARNFLDQTHIQGATKQGIFAIGAFYKEKLVGVCSFGGHHRKADVKVLNRFACLPNHTIMGFLSKASKTAAKIFRAEIISWADYSKSQANGYLAAGWVVEKRLNPDYFYYNPKTEKVISKQSRKKSAVNTPKGMTETEHAKIDGLLRVYDCGKIRLSFKIKY